MRTFIESLGQHAEQVVDAFYAELSRLPKSRHILAMLSEPELTQLKAKQRQNLLALAEPELGDAEHAAMAQRIGRIHAAVGLDKEELVRSRAILFEAIERLVGDTVPARQLSMYTQRLTADLAYQLKGYQALQDSQQEVLQRLTRAVWEEDNYTNFIERVTRILSGHDEVAACAVARPDAHGVFFFEATSGKAFDAFHAALLQSSATYVVTDADDPRGQGAIGRAWRSGQVERVINYRTDPRAVPWRALALESGPRSAAAIPIGVPGRRPLAVLVLYSPLPGGFVGPTQTSFVDLLHTLLGCAAGKLQGVDDNGYAIPVSVRQRWAALVRQGSLQMHYQPLYDLRERRITKIEALARLRDGDAVVMPDDFLAALTSDDLLALYAQGLSQALADCKRWREQDVDLALSINLPPAALHDPRYYEATRDALAAHACPPERLMLEVLENEALPPNAGHPSLLEKFEALGVLLAQDDLGSGHSSLTRLREMPFDWVKIDRGLTVGVEEAKTLETLRFILQLVRLGHALGKQVLAEGIERLDLLDALEILGVDAVQGFVVAKPLPAEHVLDRLDQAPLPVHDAAAPRLTRIAHFLVLEDRLLAIAATPGGPAALTGALRAALLDASKPFAHGPRQTEQVRETLATLAAEWSSGPCFKAQLARLGGTVAQGR